MAIKLDISKLLIRLNGFTWMQWWRSGISSNMEKLDYLKQRVQNKINSWYTKLLSPAGKEVMIKSVITAIPTYTMSCFLFSNKLLNQLIQVIRKFPWLSNPDISKIAWISWRKVTQSKNNGGLVISDFRHFNIPLLA